MSQKNRPKRRKRKKESQKALDASIKRGSTATPLGAKKAQQKAARQRKHIDRENREMDRKTGGPIITLKVSN